MAVQAISTVVDLTVSATADLTTIKDTRIADGYRVWASVAGAQHGLWCLDKNSVGPASATAVATLSGVGFWVYFGGGGASAAGQLSTATRTTLANLVTTGMPNGTLIWVISLKRYYTFDALDAGATILTERIAGFNGGMWVSQDYTSSNFWALTYSAATPCLINPYTGSDDNDGLTAGTALQSFAEVARRCPTIYQPMVITYLGAVSPFTGQFPTWDPEVIYNPLFGAAYPSITINGVESVVGVPVGNTGVINTSTNGTAATNTPPRVTDTAGAGATWPVGSIIRITSGAQIGAWAVVLKDEGAGTGRTSLWTTLAGTVLSTPPVNGSTYNFINWMQFADFAVTAKCPINLNLMQLNHWTGMELGTLTTASVYTLTNCKISSAMTFITPLGVGAIVFNACALEQVSTLVSVGNLLNINFSGIRTTNSVRVTSGGRLALGNSMFQGQGVSMPLDADTTSGGVVSFNNVAIWDSATDAVMVQRQGTAYIRGALWGSGNALKGVRARSGGRINVKTGITPTLASTGQELELENAATASAAPPLGTGVIPVAVALTTWVQWAAAPFTRNVMSYLTDSAVIDSA